MRPRRQTMVSLRLSWKEKDEILRRASENGLGYSEYMIDCALGRNKKDVINEPVRRADSVPEGRSAEDVSAPVLGDHHRLHVPDMPVAKPVVVDSRCDMCKKRGRRYCEVCAREVNHAS